jgi:hypothetical protein
MGESRRRAPNEVAVLKARNIIPGWPRGRSTSRPLAAGSVWPWEYTYDLVTGELVHVGNRTEWQGLSRKKILPGVLNPIVLRADHSATGKAEDLAEERRKADMMEAYWKDQRSLAAGKIPRSGIWDDTFRWWYVEGYGR